MNRPHHRFNPRRGKRFVDEYDQTDGDAVVAGTVVCATKALASFLPYVACLSAHDVLLDESTNLNTPAATAPAVKFATR